MATGRNDEAAEKAFRLAENLFLANDIAGALRAAREAQRLSQALPGLANAVTAYEVHAAAAATSRASGRNWYAVLAVGDRSATTSSGSVTHESLKQQYRRLCLVLHPERNRSAAADGAFKLLRQAWGELSLRHRPGARPVSRPPPATAQASNWQHCRHCGWSSVTVVDDEDVSGMNCVNCNQWVSMPRQSRPPPAGGAPPPPQPPPPRQRERRPPPATAQASNWQHCRHCGWSSVTVVDDEDVSGMNCVNCNQWVSMPRQSRPPPAGGAPPPPQPPPPRQRETRPPPATAQASNWQHCRHCGWSSVTVVDDEDVSGMNCVNCNQWVSMPPPPPPPPPPPSSEFPCPGHCTRCGAKFTDMVSVGTWLFECAPCYTIAIVHVKSPYLATTEYSHTYRHI
ncbi:hypothetical protein E2562_014038 [Oryza meyeriana var. granulata]|uniref:J domain-containing protein n=1 Tax=Oryza meyeriana var. granulata TaxID=110450 RepID=A0A6G1DIS8_9ORYZ|nr:hypothetical protein E2562_014038 [Oryza meyeriana var. granulata]